MKVIKTPLEDCLLIEPDVFSDSRGSFYESFHEYKYSTSAGIRYNFVQDNFSYSTKGVLRGLHFQYKKPQGKLVRVSRGKVFDVAVDLRKQSKSFKKWFGIELSDQNNYQLWIPPGFAHGFLVLSEDAHFQYKCTDFYDPADEGCIFWKDSDLGIEWPEIDDIEISKKDLEAPSFNQIMNKFKT